MHSELERRQAIMELLSMPDSPDLHRGHRVTVEGRSDRYHLVRDLTAVFVQTKLLELHDRQSAEVSDAPPTRERAEPRTPRLPQAESRSARHRGSARGPGTALTRVQKG